jgi:hypothetical protein
MVIYFMILEGQEHCNRLTPATEHLPALFDEQHARHAVAPHTTPHNGSLSAGTFLAYRLDAKPLATQSEVSSTGGYQGRDGVELLIDVCSCRYTGIPPISAGIRTLSGTQASGDRRFGALRIGIHHILQTGQR